MLENLTKIRLDKRLLLVSLAALATVALVACSGDDGATGPAGAVGPAGPEGPAGDVTALPGAFAATQQGNFGAVDNPAIADDDACSFLTGSADATVCTFELEGSGHSNVLGAYTEKGTWMTSIPPLSEAGITPAAILGGSVVLSSNMGEIHLEPIGPAAGLNIVGPPDETGVVPGVISPGLPFKIVGGTNQFASATGVILRTGTFSNSVVEPGAPGVYDITYVGSIAF